MLDASAFTEISKRDGFFDRAVNITFEHLQENVELESTVKDLLLMQSVQGRAIAGYWAGSYFDDKRSYPNTTLEDVFEALQYSPQEVQQQRQAIIDDIDKYLNTALELVMHQANGGEDSRRNAIRLRNAAGDPLGGIKHFLGVTISNPLDVLMGAYIGACMDSAEWRTRTENEFGITMHKGVMRAVHLETAMQQGHSLKSLAKTSHTYDDIEALMQSGVISHEKKTKSKDGYTAAYIQLKEGYGISDDAAFTATALRFGKAAGFGLLLADAVDTWDKSTPFIHRDGQDEIMGAQLKERYENVRGKGKFPVSDEDVMSIIFLASIDERTKKLYPSCSQRRFVELDRNTNLTPIDSHLVFIDHVSTGTALPPTMKIAFDQIWTHDFYQAFKQRYHRLIDEQRISSAHILPGNGK